MVDGGRDGAVVLMKDIVHAHTLVFGLRFVLVGERKSPKFPLTEESDVLLSTSFLGRSNPRVRPVYLNRTTSLEDSAGRFNSESTHRSSAVSFLLISGK
nr:hypothetical protein Iba_chr11fCG1370 [Ipomoea batatas]